jgi:hypothetical protein
VRRARAIGFVRELLHRVRDGQRAAGVARSDSWVDAPREQLLERGVMLSPRGRALHGVLKLNAGRCPS